MRLRELATRHGDPKPRESTERQMVTARTVEVPCPAEERDEDVCRDHGTKAVVLAAGEAVVGVNVESSGASHYLYTYKLDGVVITETAPSEHEVAVKLKQLAAEGHQVEITSGERVTEPGPLTAHVAITAGASRTFLIARVHARGTADPASLELLANELAAARVELAKYEAVSPGELELELRCEEEAPEAASAEAERRDQPVTADDLRVLLRADELLASAAVWNRHDTRTCTPADTTWSLYCALHRASTEVFGEYRHRAVALQEVRFAVETVTKGQELAHRLMDYNNLPTTRFEDIKRVLAFATLRVRARLAG